MHMCVYMYIYIYIYIYPRLANYCGLYLNFGINKTQSLQTIADLCFIVETTNNVISLQVETTS